MPKSSEQSFRFQRQRMNETGIGLAGLDGVWWLPSSEPFPLPPQVLHELQEIGKAVFTFFDTVTALFGTREGQAGGLEELLNHKVPPSLPRLISSGQVESVRP